MAGIMQNFYVQFEHLNPIIGCEVQVLIFWVRGWLKPRAYSATNQSFSKSALIVNLDILKKKTVLISLLSACNVLSSTFLVTRANLILTWAASTSPSSKTPCAPSSRASGTGRACSTSTKAHPTMQSRISGRKLTLDAAVLGYLKWISRRNLRYEL